MIRGTFTPRRADIIRRKSYGNMLWRCSGHDRPPHILTGILGDRSMCK